MSRIVSFALYMCVRCRQIHLRPVHGSVSTYRPTDLCIDAKSDKTCVTCRLRQPMERYLLVGSYRSGAEKIEWLYSEVAQSPEIKRPSLFERLNIFTIPKRVTSPIARYPFFEG